MPLYEYSHVGPPGPDCAGSFHVVQSMKDDALAACPTCGGAVERLIFAPAISTPKTNAELKNLGFTKLVRRDSGVYENVTATGEEKRYMKSDDPTSIPDIKKKIAD